jgi:hypothetical protein
MPLLSGTGHVAQNIHEFSGGKTFAHTADKFGADRAHKQAVAVALHQEDKGKGHEDHKAAVAKMNPSHVHALVQHAASGKAGPEAQKMAQSAMQPQAALQQGPPQQTSPFSDNDGDEGGSTGAPPQQGGGMNRSSMFGMGGGE